MRINSDQISCSKTKANQIRDHLGSQKVNGLFPTYKTFSICFKNAACKLAKVLVLILSSVTINEHIVKHSFHFLCEI